jgi:hypothetical protein
MNSLGMLYFLEPQIQFSLDSPPNFFGIKVGITVELHYRWKPSIGLDQAPQLALPFINQFSILPRAPIITAQGVGAGNESVIPHSNTSSANTTSKTPVPTNPPKPSSTSANNITKETAAFYIMCFNNKKVYVIEYTAPEDKFNQYLPRIREMVDSFDFTK